MLKIKLTDIRRDMDLLKRHRDRARGGDWERFGHQALPWGCGPAGRGTVPTPWRPQYAQLGREVPRTTAFGDLPYRTGVAPVSIRR